MKILSSILVVVLSAIFLLFLGSLIPVLDYQLKIVVSGSMEPGISQGSVVIVSPAEKIKKGDIITFSRNEELITHRVVSQRKESGNIFYTTGGDANEVVDSKEVSSKEIVGKVIFIIPALGFLIEIFHSSVGLSFLLSIISLIIILKIYNEQNL